MGLTNDQQSILMIVWLAILLYAGLRAYFWQRDNGIPWINRDGILAPPGETCPYCGHRVQGS